MDDPNDQQTQFIHSFSSPLTSLRGALDLLRHPSRMSDDPVTRELLETLDRNSARLRANIDVLLKHSRFRNDSVEIVVPLHLFASGSSSAPAPSAPPADAALELALADAAPPEDGVSSERGSILIIGLELVRFEALCTLLSAAGYRVLHTEQGSTGIDIARALHPTLMVLDFASPLADVQHVAQVLREDPETKMIPMIYATGHAPLLTHLPPQVELLPLHAAPEAQLALVAQSIAAATSLSEHMPALLIVDDDADIRRILALRFQQDNYRIVQAANGTEALLFTQKQSFDLIILDLLLPDIDGFSVLGALRARPATAMTPIILLSARDSAPEKVRGLQLGADDYVTKPFSPAELQARVLAALRRHERESGANPSTGLPGNIAIERTLRTHIQCNNPFAVCYVDIDNFKAYNDTYSFLKGDAVIQHTAQVLLQAIEVCGNQDDFVGHIGGDDFVVITTPDRFEQIAAHTIANFDLLAPLFYDAQTRQAGYIDAFDRQGRPARFPFVSLSIAIISTARHPIHHVAEVAQRSVEPKKRRQGAGRECVCD